MAEQAKFQLTLELRQIEGTEIMREPVRIDKLISVDMHRNNHVLVPTNYGALARIDVGNITGGISTPQCLLVYAPDRPVRIAVNPSADLTNAASYNSYTSNAPSAQLMLLANLDGSDLNVDQIDLACAHATLTSKTTVAASGDD